MVADVDLRFFRCEQVVVTHYLGNSCIISLWGNCQGCGSLSPSDGRKIFV